MRLNRRQFLTAAAASAGSTLFSTPVALSQTRQPLGDIIVLIPGIMGSVLQKDGRDVWALSGRALATGLRTLGQSVADLTLHGDSETAEILDDGIVASRILPDTHLLPGFWKIDGYSAISKSITDSLDAQAGRNYFEFPYDWRRDNRASARRLQRLASNWLRRWRQTSGNHDAKLVLIAHSMGGLVARYFLEVLDGWRDTRMLVTFGTPYRGSLNALDVLANGLKRQMGPFTVLDMSMLVRSFTSVYQLLPVYPCFDPGTGTLQRVVEASAIPNVERSRAQAALKFHQEIQIANEGNARRSEYVNGRYTLHPIVGTYQPTRQIGKLMGTTVQMLDEHPQAKKVRGDGTVPEASATPIEPDDLTKQHRTVYVAEVHGSLQNAPPMLDHVRAVILAGGYPQGVFRQRGNRIALQVSDLYSASKTVACKVGCEAPNATLTAVVSEAATRRTVATRMINVGGEVMQDVDLGRLREGTYRLRVSGGSDVSSATDTFVVVGS